MRMLVLAILAASLAALDLQALPHPRASGWLLDPHGTVPAEAAGRIRAAAASARGQLAICVLPDCSGREPRAAGLALFNRWGLGDPVRHDGVLLLIALQERRAEFLLGDGLDDDANVLRSQAIIDRDLRPRLRAGDLGGGVAAAAEAAARELFGAGQAPDLAAIDIEVPAGTGGVTPPPGAQAAPPRTMVESMPAPTPSPPSPSPFRDTPMAAPSVGNSGLLLVGGGGIAALLGGFGTMAWLRRRPRICPSCRTPMQRLDEAADDAHLTSGQRAEERVGSVDYDVWACPSCPAVLVTRHGAWFSGHHTCPGCGAKTASDRNTIIAAATTLSTGTERIDTHCSHCGHHEVRHRTIPRVQQRRHGGFGSSSGGGGFRSSSGGGGFRSSSGGSSGGGRSSGRGGGGGW